MRKQYGKLLLVSFLFLLLISCPAMAAVQGSSWAQPVLEEAVQEGLVAENLLTDAASPASREDLAALAVGFYSAVTGSQLASPAQVPFQDTQNPQVAIAYELGIMSGVGDGQFQPEGSVTREQMASVLVRLFRLLGVTFTSPTAQSGIFADEDAIASWARSDVYCLEANGMVAGDEAGYFHPTSAATKEQIVTVLMQGRDRLLGDAVRTAQGVTVGESAITLGESRSSVEGKLGSCQAQTRGITGTSRGLYQTKEGYFVMVGYREDAAVEVYTNGIFRCGSFTSQTTYASLNLAEFSSYSEEKAVREENGVSMTLFFDGDTSHGSDAVYLCRTGLSQQTGQYDGSYDEDVETELYYMINGLRQKNGLSALRRNPFSDGVAQDHADEMKKYLQGSYLSADGRTFFERMDQAGLHYAEAGELICTTIEGEAMDIYGWWMSSLSSRNNLLEDAFTDIGLGATGVPQRICFYVTVDLFAG